MSQGVYAMKDLGVLASVAFPELIRQYTGRNRGPTSLVDRRVPVRWLLP
jgi:hypothetical protein